MEAPTLVQLWCTSSLLDGCYIEQQDCVPAHQHELLCLYPFYAASSVRSSCQSPTVSPRQISGEAFQRMVLMMHGNASCYAASEN